MQQSLLPFKYECERETTGLTAFAGLPVYADLLRVSGLLQAFDEHLGVRRAGQGWTDSEICQALILLSLAGGESVSDLEILEKDDGLRRVMLKASNHGLSRKQLRELERRWRKERKRAVPSESSVFRYLESFHNASQEQEREAHKAFIPEQNPHLRGFASVAKHLLAFVQRNAPQSTATLDIDATLQETNKLDALWTYKKFKGYQPVNVWWAEQEQMVLTEFRDGNVPASFELKRVLEQSLQHLPDGVKRVRLRSDTAGYQKDLLRFCQDTKHELFKRIEFGIGCPINEEFRKAVAAMPESAWKRLTVKANGREHETSREWAEICFVPNSLGHSKNGPHYRFLATREVIEEQRPLPGMENEVEYSFPTYEASEVRYKLRGYVTNMDWEGQELIHWICKRCGKSEEVHAILKSDLAGGRFPSGKSGANAAWWWLAVLACNVSTLMKRLVLGGSWATKRLKALRFHLISIPGRVITRARQLILRINHEHPSFKLLQAARQRIAGLKYAPG